ncbi:hypothetical protein GYMLUDRAFT_240589 [Collybiopsis luxurians FD-317 M1]|nr:hypothetical protein GYMLUDRAFT_240589 [Collybiopsis luxurians FD-317 M1]
MTLVRGLFILARYLAIIIHIADIVLTSVITAKTGEHKQMSEHLCMSLIIFRLASGQSMLLILHFISMLRVFALYNQSILVGVFLLVLIVVGSAGPTVNMLRGFTGAKIESPGYCFHKTSLTARTRYSVLILICGELVIQLILHGLAWKRTIWEFRRLTLFRPTLISVLNRDGLKMFAGILVAIIAITVAAFKRGTAAVFIFPLFITFVSASGTRTILNLQALSNEAAPSSPKSTNQVELTGVEDLTSWELDLENITWACFIKGQVDIPGHNSEAKSKAEKHNNEEVKDRTSKVEEKKGEGVDQKPQFQDD